MNFEEHSAELEKEKKLWDAYYYPDSNCLVNKLNIQDVQLLEKQETIIVNAKMAIVNGIMDEMYKDTFSAKRLFSIHDFLFSDIYTWAGKKRDVDIFKNEKVLSNQSVEYVEQEQIEHYMKQIMKNYNSSIWDNFSYDQKIKGWCQCIAELWQTHPFREGNTRTCTIFALEFAKKIGLSIDSMDIADRNKEFRDALVLYSSGQTDILEDMVREIEGAIDIEVEMEIQGQGKSR